MTDCKTHYITKVVNVMKTHQKKMLNDYHEYGEFREPRKQDFWSSKEEDTDIDSNPYIDNEYL
jgi:hypothetical protein